ncbi:hypothetical protein BC827DRAFT_276462 [Russula dissimulans]|nr:hypothetical protein BC827DRAFT_276462 [Russula dissimulans]
MRFNRVFSFLPISDVKLAWERITASRIAIAYIIFSVLNCTVQVILQAQAFSINKEAANFLSRLIHTGNASLPGFFVLGSQLHFCDHVPKAVSTESCEVVWNGTISGTGNMESALSTPVQQPGASASSSSPSSSSVTTSSSSRTTTVHNAQPTTNSTKTSPARSSDDRRYLSAPQIDVAAIIPTPSNGVTLQGFEVNGQNATLDKRCLVALNWPVQMLRDTKREDISFLTFQFWVLGMSLVAVLNESIPHIMATVLTHLSATAWGAFQIYSTDVFHDNFRRLTTDGACGINLLPRYWTLRAQAEILSLAFNVAALLVSCFLSFRLIKLFGWQTFKRVGASRSINRIYKLVLTLSIVIQLSLFFVVLAVALWLDQLYHGAIAIMATQSDVYQAFLMIIIVLLIPWLLTGWFASRKELKFLMMVFLVLSAGYLVGFGLMFDSETFRWTYVEWGFFGSTVTISALLTLISFIVGIMCRLNFDKGLVHYLKGEEPLREDSFIQTDSGAGNPFGEKFDFPSTRYPIPTFSATVGPNEEGYLPSRMGPRFFNHSALPFESQVEPTSVTRLSGAQSMSPDTDSPGTGHLSRHGSQHSNSSQVSSITLNEPFMGQSRWVIE